MTFWGETAPAKCMLYDKFAPYHLTDSYHYKPSVFSKPDSD